MLNINEKMDYLESEDKSDNFEQESPKQLEFYNSKYNVNFFGAGQETEDFQ
jgi:hypothetical protein